MRAISKKTESAVTVKTKNPVSCRKIVSFQPSVNISDLLSVAFTASKNVIYCKKFFMSFAAASAFILAVSVMGNNQCFQPPLVPFSVSNDLGTVGFAPFFIYSLPDNLILEVVCFSSFCLTGFTVWMQPAKVPLAIIEVRKRFGLSATLARFLKPQLVRLLMSLYLASTGHQLGFLKPPIVSDNEFSAIAFDV